VNAPGWRDLLHQVADAVGHAVDGLDPSARRAAGNQRGQYRLDLVADAVVLERLSPTGARLLTEETGLVGSTDGAVGANSALTVVVDPVDGSTNLSRGVPHAACSLCVVDGLGPWVSVVVDIVTGERFDAIRGQGARLGGIPLSGPSGCVELSEAIVGLAGWPGRALPWAQFRVLGAAALDLCYVAAGRLDAYADGGRDHGVWDYMAALLVLSEAGAAVGERAGAELVVLDPAIRLGPVAAATPELLDELLASLPGVVNE
jgi:myo-inositol-1(or 4)-monophosphatase